MLYLKRKIDAFLSEWKENPDKKPLIVKGPRQVGKTESIQRFAAENYTSVITINFVEEPKYKMITADGYKAADIIKNISRIDPSKRFIEGETLIFFDELQEFPDIATALKFFKIDGRFDVICSGSMLGINYRKIESNSVGYKTDYEMFSLDFEEFLWAGGYDDAFIDDMLTHMRTLTPFNELEMSVCSELFLNYCILGGMPAVVREFIEKGTFEGSLETQRQLIADYKEDIRKYADGMDQTRILNVFQHIPVQLAKDNKKFQISKVASGARFRDYRGCIEWLNDAGMVNICYCLNFPELPLKGNYDETKYKLYFADSGLLVAMLMRRRRRTCAPTKTSACTRAHCMRMWSVRRSSRPGISCITTSARIPRSSRISSSARHPRSFRSRSRPREARRSLCARSSPVISMRIFTMASNLPPEISGSVTIFIRSFFLKDLL